MFGLSRLATGLIIAGVIAVLGAVVLGGPVIAFFQGKVAKSEQKAETATDDATARRLEAGADQRLDKQAFDFNITVAQGKAATADLQEDAHADPSGAEPLPAASVDRLRRHDQFLCQQRPALCTGAEGRRTGGEGSPGPVTP